MLNVKLLAGSFVGAAGAFQLWTDPGRWAIVLDVIGALILSWIIFVAALYLAAARLRREPGPAQERRILQPASRGAVEYDRRLTRIPR